MAPAPGKTVGGLRPRAAAKAREQGVGACRTTGAPKGQSLAKSNRNLRRVRQKKESLSLIGAPYLVLPTW